MWAFPALLVALTMIVAIKSIVFIQINKKKTKKNL